jgi:glycosidase
VRHSPSHLCLLLLAAAATGAELPAGVTVSRPTGQIVLANSVVELRFEAASGRLTGYGPVGGPAVASGGACGAYLKGAKRWTDTAPAAAVTRIETDSADGQGLLRLTSADGDWRRIEEWRLAPDSSIALRQCRWEYLGTAEDEVTSTRFWLNSVRLPGADDAELVLPTAFPTQTVAFAALQPGRRRDVPDTWTTNSLVLVRSRHQDRAVLLLAPGGLDSGWSHVEEAAGSVNLEQGFGTQLRLGHPAAFAARWQALALCGASRASITETCRQAFDRVGLRAIANPAADAAIVYSAHPGGSIDTGFRDVGGFQAFTARLDYVRGLGFNTLWLLPFWNGYVYAPVDYAKLDARLGTEADLKALVDRAHGLGMKVLGDLIPHGPREEGGLLKQHPDWVSAKHDGGVLYWWGCLGCDYAHPGWQGFMADHAVDWMSRVGLDGYRVDCAGGGPPNWRPYGDNWPSLSGLTGARQLLAAVRAKMQAHTKGSLLITEGTAPVLAESGDIVYDFPWAYEVLPAALHMAPKEWVPAAREWLAWRQAEFPRGTRLMHYATSHDTVRGPWRYGPDLERALLALNALLDGVPMVYDGEEEGFADTLAAVNRWRAALQALRGGDADYESVDASDPRVLAFARGAGAQKVVVAVNFASTAVSFELSAGRAENYDAATGLPGSDLEGRPEGRPRATLAPGDVAIWVSPHRGQALVRGAGIVPDSSRDGRTTGTAGTPLTAPWGQATLEGLRLARLEVGGQGVLWGSHLAEGRRKLFFGVPPIDFDAQQVHPTTTGDGTAVGQFTVAGADGRPAVDVSRRYRLGARPEDGLLCETVLTARHPVERANAELVQSFDLGPAPDIVVPTVEGQLHFGPRYPLPRQAVPGDGGRYRHRFGEVLWESCRLPLAGPILLVRPHLSIVASAVSPWLQNLRLRRDAGPDGHVWLEVAWLDQLAPVSLAAGESVTLTIGIKGTEPFSAAEKGSVPFIHEGSNWVFENPYYRLVLGRSGGGSIRELRRKAGDGWGPNLIAGLQTYTDVGLYPDAGDPEGEQHHRNARSQEDIEPDVAMERDGARTRFRFTGTLRGANDGDVDPVRPYSWYRHEFVLDDSPVIRLRLGFRPRAGFEEHDTAVFAAHTLSLTGVTSWTAHGGDGVTTKPAAPTFADRCWQSLQHGGLAAGGFGLTCGGGTLRIVPEAGAEHLQNAFLLDGGGGNFTLFLAPYDLQPVKVPAAWIESDWRLEP